MTAQPGDIYRAGGGKSTRFWLVIAVNGNSCPVIGLDVEMNITTAQTYATYYFDRRKLVGKVDLSEVRIEP
jgi:hypothetical protein